MPTFKCEFCGQEHDELLRDLAYMYPADYFEVPEDERPERIRVNDDLCVIDDSDFYIRGVLALPIRNSAEEFRWGVWAKVRKADFDRYLELWDSALVAPEPASIGELSGGIAEYPDTDMLDVRVVLQAGNQRPRFYVVSEKNQLGIDQRSGITEEKAHQFVMRFVKNDPAGSLSDCCG